MLFIKQLDHFFKDSFI